MPELNANIPQFRCWVRREFLYDLREGQGQFDRGVAHAVASLPGRCLTFHVLLDNGAQFGRLPIHAICHRPDAAPLPPTDPWRVQMWDCFSYECSVLEYRWLLPLRVRARLADGSLLGGRYAFTVDYYGTRAAEDSGDAGWKCHHLLFLDDGCVAALPNNRICWGEPACVEPFDKPPAYRTLTQVWSVEDGPELRQGRGDRFFAAAALPPIAAGENRNGHVR